MQSALAAIPAMIEVTFPDGFTPAEATRVEATFTRSAINCESPACSASAITGTRPASDTKCSSSNSGVALDHACDSFTASAFWFQIDQDVNTPDSSVPEGTSTSASPRGHRSAADRPRIEAKHLRLFGWFDAAPHATRLPLAQSTSGGATRPTSRTLRGERVSRPLPVPGSPQRDPLW